MTPLFLAWHDFEKSAMTKMRLKYTRYRCTKKSTENLMVQAEVEEDALHQMVLTLSAIIKR